MRSFSLGYGATVFVVAHRTPATRDECERVAAAGASVFELDVQLSGRGVVVSHFLRLPPPVRMVEHDNWRFRRSRGLIADPLLADAVALVPAGCRILLDLKETDPGRRRDLREALVDAFPTPARCVVSTEEVEDLEAMRRAGFATWRTARSRRALARLVAEGYDGEGVSVRHTLLDRVVVARLRDRDHDVVAWTVNDVARVRQLRDLGVTGITTDSLAVVAEAGAR